MQPLSLDPTAPGAFGRFLEGLSVSEVGPPRLRRVVRRHAASGWRAGYASIEILPSVGSGNLLAATLYSARPPAQGTLTYRCDIGSDAALSWWLFGGEGAAASAALRFESGGASFPVALPQASSRLVAYEVDLGTGFCAGPGDDARIEIVASDLPDGMLISEPVLLVPDGDELPPPVILISLDTLRADSWDHDRIRPPSLASFFEDAIRYRRAYSAAPSTWPAHSVMLSGLYLDQIEERPIWELPSIAGDLRERGYLTQAFVSGGYVRARFGYQTRVGKARARPPGFALGFDLYLEGMHDPNAGRRGARPQARTALELERLVEPMRYSLGPALERSLRWWRHDPGLPAFHLIHGYDVHEYRSASRLHWDRTLEAHAASDTDPDELRRCVTDAGIEMDDEFVSLPFAWESDESCRPLVISLLYEARVRSVEDALGRYLDELRALGVYDRAVVVVTSDHGESLLDESGLWGHSMLLANNLHVPLWIKPARAAGRGRDEDGVTGLVALRAMLERMLGASGAGVDGSPGGPQTPLRFAGHAGTGLVLADGELCRWTLPERTLEVFREGRWQVPFPSIGRRCELADAEAHSARHQVLSPSVPADLEDELRVLGYVE